MRMSSDDVSLVTVALRSFAVRMAANAKLKRNAGPLQEQFRDELRQRARDSVALALRMYSEPLPLLGARIADGVTVIAALPLFPGSEIPDYIVAAYREPRGDTPAGFGTWRASCVPPGPWLFEGGKWFAAADNTADTVRAAARRAMQSLAERAGPGLCMDCGGPLGELCPRCA